MEWNATAYVKVCDDTEETAEKLSDQKITCKVVSEEALAFPLKLERGDSVVQLMSGEVMVTQDALSVRVSDAELIEVCY